MAKSSSENFDSLLTKIALDDSDGGWIDTVKHFCFINADAFSLPSERKDEFLSLLKDKIHDRCSEQLAENSELLLLLCDCTRISVRDKSKTEALMKEDFLSDLLLILESSFHSDAEPPQSALPEMVLRCLINMMNGNISASDLFLGETVNGLNKVLELLQDLGTSNRYSAMMHLGTKLMYMLMSQRSERMGPLLRTEAAESIFFLQLSLCLSLSHYKDLKRRLERWCSGDFSRSRVQSVAAAPSDVGDEVGAMSLSSAVDDGAHLATSPEDVEVELAPSLMSVGLVREEWGSLFVETCKLVYSLYGQSDNESDLALLPSVNMSLLYDLLSDVILTPLRDNDQHYTGRAMQITCRRHALQLAMLSLDLPTAATHDAGVSSEVSLILQKLLERDGVRILCGLLDEYFSEAAAAESEGSSGRAYVAPVVVLCPILVLLNRLTTSAEGRAELKALIFPNPWREDDAENENDPNYLQEKMDPTDIPPGTLRAHLIGLMTSLDSVLKRYCAELLYALCDKESGEFVTRTGFGNAVALMQIKGLI